MFFIFADLLPDIGKWSKSDKTKDVPDPEEATMQMITQETTKSNRPTIKVGLSQTEYVSLNYIPVISSVA